MHLPCPSSTRLLTSTFQVLPLAAARYHYFVKGYTPFGVVVVADGFYLFSGLLNVILYVYTRPDLLPHDIDSDNQSMAHSDHDDAQPEGVDAEYAGGFPIVVEPKPSELTYADREPAHPDDGKGEGPDDDFI
jgi:hypothetical protein